MTERPYQFPAKYADARVRAALAGDLTQIRWPVRHGVVIANRHTMKQNVPAIWSAVSGGYTHLAMPGDRLLAVGASRLTLEVTAVKIERLHVISTEDAARSCCCSPCGSNCVDGMSTQRVCFMDYWDSTHPKGLKWADNPWVWAATVKRIET